MRIAFIQFLHYEGLGIMYLSSSLKMHGHTVEVFICPAGRDHARFVETVAGWRPDVAAFSVLSGSEQVALAISRQIKRRIPAYSIFGGPHPTLVPAMVGEEGVDCVCRGEAEETLADIVNALGAGDPPEGIPGAWFKTGDEIVRNEIRNLNPDLDRLSWPDRHLYRSRYRSLRSRRAGFITGRGCPYQCAFCSSPAVMRLYRGKGPYVRKRSVGDVIEEIREVKRAFHIRTVYFEDDTFILNREWVLDFCARYGRDVGLPFSCHIRADLATEELIAALAGANCKTVSFGIETGNARRRNLLLKKHVTDDQIVACSGLLRRHGIRFRALNILGLPGETIGDSVETVALNARIRPDFPWCAIFQPLPATELWEYCRKNNLLTDEITRSHPTFFKDSPILLDHKNEIENLQKLFFYAVKLPALQKAIRSVVGLRPNAVFDMLFLLAQAWNYLRSERLGLLEVCQVGWMNFSRYLPTGRRHGIDRTLAP